MQLYSDQQEFADDIVMAIWRGIKKLVCQLSTAGGKTVVFSNLAHRYVKKFNRPVLIQVHREELLKQTRATLFEMYGIVAVPIVAGMKHIPDAMVYVGMIESTYKRLHKIKDVGLMILDECHIASFNKMNEEAKDDCTVLGFTATAISSSKKRPLNLHYEDIVCGKPISWLIKEGRLAQNITYSPKNIVDRMKLQVKGGEFDEKQMFTEYSKSKYIHNTVKQYKERCLGKKTLIFNVNMAHSRAVNDAFVKAGYNSRYLDSNCEHNERLEILKWFKETKDAILNNVGIATTGFDERTVEAVIVNKATMSVGLWIQMTGRGGRIVDEDYIDRYQNNYKYELKEKTFFIIIDMGGNAVAHGDWSQDRDWKDIFHNPPKPGKGGVAPLKDCINCEALIPAGARICKFCGYVQPSASIPIESELEEFIVVTKGIDVDLIMRQHDSKNPYYTFFLLGRMVAHAATKQKPHEFTDALLIFILETYHEIGRRWRHSLNKKYNKWHQDKAAYILFKELKRLNPNIKLIEEYANKYDKPVSQGEPN